MRKNKALYNGLPYHTTLKVLLLLIGGCLGTNSIAQVQLSGNIESHISNIISSMPGDSGNDFAEPTNDELNTWARTVKDVLLTNYTTAQNRADSLDYELVQFTDNTLSPVAIYYMLQQKAGSTNYWGTYLFNAASCRGKLVIQAPHPKKDFNTGKQGIFIFKNIDARVFMMSGTHRCNNSTFTTCDGTSSVCTGSSNSYQISDLAHNTTTVFQKTTQVIDDILNNMVYVQLHGFTKLSTDPYVILSNGTTANPSGTDYADAIKTALFNADNTLTFKVAHLDNWTRLIGTTNTQGRLINGVNAPCNTAANIPNGRFVHLEQEKNKLRDDSTGWTKVAIALANVFTCQILAIEWHQLGITLIGDKIQVRWTTFSEINTDFFTVQKSKDGTNWVDLGDVQGAVNSSTFIDYEFLDDKPYNGLSYYRIRLTDLDGFTDFSDVLTITYTADEALSIYPNPTNGTFTIASGFTIDQVLVYNNLGKLVIDASPQDNFLDINTLPTGVYFCKIFIENEVYEHKQVVIR